MNAPQVSDGRQPGKTGTYFMTTLNPEWKWAGHMSGDRCSTMYRDNKLGIQAEKWCNRREGDGPAGYEYYGGGVSFFIDSDKTEYKTEAEMLAALAIKRGEA